MNVEGNVAPNSNDFELKCSTSGLIVACSFHLMLHLTIFELFEATNDSNDLAPTRQNVVT